jgi:hypothetical protein
MFEEPHRGGPGSLGFPSLKKVPFFQTVFASLVVPLCSNRISAHAHSSWVTIKLEIGSSSTVFDVLLTLNLSIILAIEQLNAQILVF